MPVVIVTVVLVAGIALFVYVIRERLGPAGLGMAALRTIALGALLVLLANPARERPAGDGPTTVLLDASLSLAAAGSQWTAALDSAAALAAAGGVVLRVGDGVTSFDSAPPTDGSSLVGPGLRAAAGRGGRVFLVTDGELIDFEGIPRALRDNVTVVLFPRDTVPNAALLDVALRDRARVEDSIPVALEVATWGGLAAGRADVEIAVDGRVILRDVIRLPPAPGVARRSVAVPAGRLPAGTHVLDITVRAPGDAEAGDDTRQRVLSISALPAIALIARPADWESRFLMAELRGVTRATIRGLAEVTPGGWIDMQTLEPVDGETVNRLARGAALLVTRGEWNAPRRRGALWRWPSASDGVRFSQGDWYPVSTVPASPLGGPLGAIEWDSLPPLTGIVPMAPVRGEWIALSARLGRRGAERPALVGRDSAGLREMTTAAGGLWRWSLRGGASREAYRAVLAAGVDWLLGGTGTAATGPMVASDVVPRGVPVLFRWRAGPAPGDVALRVTGPDSTFTERIVFDGEGTAQLRLPPGSYRWQLDSLPGAGGLAVVERYSDEFHLGVVNTQPALASSTVLTLLVNVREQWWVFALAIAALVGEWAWRTRRGLP